VRAATLEFLVMDSDVADENAHSGSVNVGVRSISGTGNRCDMVIYVESRVVVCV